MKTPIILAVATSMFIAALPANAEEIVKETVISVQPTEVIGTVTEFVPDAISVRVQEGAAPIRYSYTKTTEYVDEAGNRITQDIVKSGMPVTIRYTKVGDRMVVNRVIVRKQVAPAPHTVITTKKTTTTTTKKDKDDDDDDDDDD